MMLLQTGAPDALVARASVNTGYRCSAILLDVAGAAAASRVQSA